MKIRLIKDLSNYDKHLVIGAEGIARVKKITHNEWSAEMVEVKIPGALPLPIGWSALEIIDKSFWKEREKDIKQATFIELGEGPRGGFKWLRIYSKDKNMIERIYTTNIKNEAEKLLILIKKSQKEVNKIIK